MSGVLLVTGASRGIGAATALAGARAGYAVAVHYGVHLGEADAVCAKILSNGGKAIVVQGDMASETDIVSMFKTIDSELGTITALVNNAGSVIAVRAITDIDSSIIDRILAVNLAGPIQFIAAGKRSVACRQLVAGKVARLSIFRRWQHYLVACRMRYLMRLQREASTRLQSV